MGAFDNYKPPGQDATTSGDATTGGAFSGYKPPASAAPTLSAPPPGYQSPSWLPGAGWLHKMSNIFDDSATFGGADAATASVGNLLRNAGVQNATPDTATLRAQTQQNRTDVGPIASGAADIAGYVVGPGELKLGGALTEKLGGGLLARVGGSAAEGAGASALGTAGHGDTDVGDLLKSAATGGTIGAATGALPGGAGKRPTTPSTADLLKTKDAAFAPLHTTPVNAPRLDAAFNGVAPRSGANVNLSDTFKSKIADIEKEVSGTTSGLTAADVADYQRALWSKTRNPFDQKVAGQYESALDGVVGPSTAYDIKAANAAHNTFKTSGELDKLVADPASAPAWLANRLAKKPALYQSQPGLFDALSAVGDRANPPSLLRRSINYAADAAARSAITAGGAYALGQNPWAGAMTGLTSKVLLPHVTSGINTIPIKNALLAAQHLNATGMKVDPSVYTSMGLQIPGMLARQTGYGLGASGAF